MDTINNGIWIPIYRYVLLIALIYEHLMWKSTPWFSGSRPSVRPTRIFPTEILCKVQTVHSRNATFPTKILVLVNDVLIIYIYNTAIGKFFAEKWVDSNNCSYFRSSLQMRTVSLHVNRTEAVNIFAAGAGSSFDKTRILNLRTTDFAKFLFR